MPMILRNAEVDDSDADTDDELLREWSDKQISNFFWDIANLSELIPIWFNIFSFKNIATFFQTELDSVRIFFLALNMFFVSCESNNVFLDELFNILCFDYF